MSFNIEFKKNGMAEGYLECAPQGGHQQHVKTCQMTWKNMNPCECPWKYIDNQKAIFPFDCKLTGICLVAFTPSDAEAVIEFENNKTVKMPYNGTKINVLDFDLDIASPKKGQGVRVRLTKPTKHPIVILMFDQ